MAIRFGLLTGLAVALAAPAGAQPAGRPGRFEVAVSGLWQGGYGLGATEATLTPSQPGAPPFVLFRTSSRFEPVGGLETRLAYRLTRLFSAEAGLAFATPRISTRISDDVEGAQAIATERLSQYVLDAAVVAHLEPLAFRGGRGVPFLTGGIGYLRQLDEAALLLETGRIYHVGGGVKARLLTRPQRFLKGLGLRADARMYLREGGFDVGDDRRVYMVAGLGAFVAF